MKNNFALIGLVVLTMFTATAFTSALGQVEKQQPKKQRHIRIEKEVDGKKAVLDTVIAGGDKFVWKGDTIGGKMWAQGRPFRPGMMRQGMGQGMRPGMRGGMMEQGMRPGMGQGMRQGMRQGMMGQGMRQGMMRPQRFMAGRDSIGNNTFMFRREIGGGRAPMSGHRNIGGMKGMMPGGFANQMQKRNFNGRQFGGGAPQRQNMMNGPRGASFPQGPNMRIQRTPELGNAIDLSDLNIISYKIKKMSGNKEKIEIIRKKSDRKARPSSGNFSGMDQVRPPMRGARGQKNQERREMRMGNTEKTEKEVPNEQNK